MNPNFKYEARGKNMCILHAENSRFNAKYPELKVFSWLLIWKSLASDLGAFLPVRVDNNAQGGLTAILIFQVDSKDKHTMQQLT